MSEDTRQTSLQALQSLREAVIEEYRRKAKLGQYVVIERDGKPCKVPAEEALREAEAAMEASGDIERPGNGPW